jgi:hypothetical protein
MALQLFHAGKYGHSQRPGAVGALPVFGYPGDLAAAAPDWTNFSLAAHLSKQRAQPSVQPGVGLSVLNAVHFPRDTILESQAKTISDFIFGPLDDAATIPLTSANRFKGMSSSPVEALLMCGKFAVAISEDGDVIYGDPVLFVLDAPMVPHRGNLAMASQMWPGSSAFAPMPVPFPSSPISLLGGSTCSSSRTSRPLRVDKSLSDFLTYQVYCLEGIPTFTREELEISRPAQPLPARGIFDSDESNIPSWSLARTRFY